MAIVHFERLPPHLVDIQSEMEEYARQYGLDFFPTIFEMVDADGLNEVAAYGGFPTRYPHWRFGMEYEQLSKGYTYGLQKIYELVINNDPCYAYLMNSNGLTDQKMVIAHVYGHCDFFKNNHWFSKTNRKMMDQMANHGNRIRRYMDRFGVEEVETFIDSCLSVEDLIDIHAPFIRRRDDDSRLDFASVAKQELEEKPTGRFDAKDYLDPYINPPSAMAAHQKQLDDEERKLESLATPSEPFTDVMLYVLENAPLKAWQLDVLPIIRDEAYYFAPQGQTKIMNEGWASFWHSTIMTRQGLLPQDVVNYCGHHAGTMASSPTQLNPYKLGLELLRDIEDRWNRGRFGKEYDECTDRQEKTNWDTQAGLGREKIFEVRRIHNDLTFIDEFLTLEFCREHKLFKFGYNADFDVYEIESRAFPMVKQQLLTSLTNRGRPRIQVRNGNYKNRGELLLEHIHDGVDLKLDYARDTLANLHNLWRRPVALQTVLDEEPAILSFDGSQHTVIQGEEVSSDES